MNTQILKSFVEVAREQSYTRAASNLYLSQPSVYQHVRQLSQMLGLSLVEQRGKRVVLTFEGKLALAHAIRMIDEENRLFTAVISDRDALRTGTLDILVGTTFGQSVMPTCIGEFNEAYPGIRVRSTLMRTANEMNEALLSFGYDASIHSGRGETPGLAGKKLFADELVLIVSGQSRLADATSVEAADLRDGIISYRPQGELRQNIDRWAADASVTVPTKFELDSQYAMMLAVLEGYGVAIVNRTVCRPLVARGILRAITLVPPLTKAYSLFIRSGTEAPPALKRFAEFVVKHTADLTGSFPGRAVGSEQDGNGRLPSSAR